MVDRKRPPIVVWIIVLLIGFSGLFLVTQRPSFEMYRSVDVVQLVASGACLGVALIGIIFKLRGR